MGRTPRRQAHPTTGSLRFVRLTAAITEEDGWYVARCLEVEVTSQGETIEAARANLAEALELYFEDLADLHVSGPPLIAPVDIAV